MKELSETLKHSVPGTPEHEKLEQEQRIAAVESKVEELNRLLEISQREVDSAEVLRRHRAMLIGEIRAEAAVIAKERNYSVVIGDGSGLDDSVSVIASGNVTDITEDLLSRLNKKFQSCR